MRKIFVFILFSLFFGSFVHAGNYVVGVNQINKLLNQIEQGTGVNPPAPPANTDKDSWSIDGITLTANPVNTTYLDHSGNSNWFGFYSVNFSNRGYKQKKGTTISLIQPSLNEADYSAVPENYSSFSEYWDRNDLSWLETINFSGNDFNSVKIDGNNIMPLKLLSLADNPNLTTLDVIGCPNLRNVDITGCNLDFSKVSNIVTMLNLPETAVFNYEYQGLVSQYYGTVDLTDILIKSGEGTIVQSWTVAPLSNSGNIYTFSADVAGGTTRVFLTNPNFPDLKIAYDIKLLNSLPVEISAKAMFCSVSITNLTSGGNSVFVGDEVLVAVKPFSCSNFDSFKIDGVETPLDSKNQYHFVAEKEAYQIEASYVSDGLAVGQTTNYIRNGSFEYGLNLDWEYNIGNGTNAEFSLERSDAMHGAVSMKVDVKSLAAANAVSAKTKVTVGCDSLYLLHFWAKGPEESKLYVEIEGSQQSGILYELHEGATAYHYPFKSDSEIQNKELTITFYFQDDKTKVKVENPCSVTTYPGATYYLDGLVLVDQLNDMHYDVYNTYIWNYNHVRNSERRMWTAGDNDVSFDLPDGRRMWFFNDSFYGVMHPERNRFVDGGQFVRNAVVIQELDGKLTTLPVTNQGGQWTYFRIPEADVIKNTDGSVKNIFWVGDALIEDNEVKVYLIEVFGQDRSYLGKFTYPELEFIGIEQQEEFCRTYETFFVENDKIYLYRTESEGTWGRYMHAARADLGDLSGKKGTWEFWNGTAWSKDRSQSARISDLMSDGVIRLGEGNYAQVSMPLMSPEVHVAFAPAPQGPWTNRQKVAEGDKSAKFWYYMPNFHGQLPNGKYSISFSANYGYCLFFCKDCEFSSFVDKYWYRQRYIQVDLLGLSPYTKNRTDCAGELNGTAYFDDCGTCVGGNTGLMPCLDGVSKVYSDTNYSGIGLGLNAGEYKSSDLAALGFQPNELSSFVLDNGYVIELYSEDNFQGEMMTFETGIGDLVEQSFDNKTNSLIIRRKGVEHLQGTFAVQNKQSELYLGVEGNSLLNNAFIVQKTYTGDDSQKFELINLGKGVYSLLNVGSNKPINIINQSLEAKAFVEQWDGSDIDITMLPGTISTQYTGSPNGEDVTKLIDKNINTKFLTFHAKAWVQYNASESYVLTKYSLTSANDAPVRDPREWVLSGSNDGIIWTEIDTQSGVVFTNRFEEKIFHIENTKSYSKYRIEVTCNTGSVLQFAELKLYALTNVNSGNYFEGQKFVIQDAGDGYVKIVNKASDMPLEILDGVKNEDEKVWQNTDVGQWGGLWKLQDPNNLPNSVNAATDLEKIVVYPNPVSDNINLHSKYSLIKRVLIVDLSGRTVIDGNYNESRINLSVSNLSNGVYMLKVFTDGGASTTHKIVKL